MLFIAGDSRLAGVNASLRDPGLSCKEKKSPSLEEGLSDCVTPSSSLSCLLFHKAQHQQQAGQLGTATRSGRGRLKAGLVSKETRGP